MTRRFVWALIPAILVASACGNRAGRDLDTTAQSPTAVNSGYASESDAGTTAEAPVDDYSAAPATATPETPSGGSSSPGATSSGAPSAGTASAAQPSKAASAPRGAGPATRPSAGPTAANPGERAAANPGGNQPSKPSAASSPAPEAPAPRGGGAPAPAGPKPPVTIANIGHWSGVLGNMGIPTLHGVKAWVGDVNARGGLNGHPVRLVSADDNSEPGRALSEARRMVEQEKAIAILGTWMPLTLHAVTPYLEEKQVAAIGTCNCEPVDDDSPMVFPVGPGGLGNAYLHSLPMLTSVDQSVRDNIGVLYCREAPICPFTQKNLRQLQDELNFKIVWEGQASIAAPDYTAEILSAQSAGVKALIDVIDNYSVLRIERSAQRQGYEVIHSVQHSMFDSRFEGKPELDGVYTASAVPMWNLSPKMADYREALKKYVPGGVPAAWGATPWVGGKLLEKVGQSFSPNPTPADVLAGLWALNNETLGGLLPGLTYHKGETHKMSNMCMIPVRMQNNKFVPRDGDPDKFICAPGWKPGLHG